MGKYRSIALAVCTAQVSQVTASSTTAFVSQTNNKIVSRNSKQNNVHYTRSNTRQYLSAIPYDEFAELDNSEASGQLIPGLIPSTTSLLDSIPPDNQDEVDELLAKKERRRVARLQTVQKPKYQIRLPIVGSLVQPEQTDTNDTEEDNPEILASLVAKGQEIAVANTIGMSLRQVYSGRKLSELALDVDTLRFQSFVDELQGRRVDGEEAETTNGESVEEKNKEEQSSSVTGSVQVLQNSALEMLSETFDGVIVSSVAQGGLAWESGVRAGDVLTATSATLGDKLWPKSTLDGVRSAISSRKVIVPTMDFEFRRLGLEVVDGFEAVQSFELSLSRPIGINVEGELGYCRTILSFLSLISHFFLSLVVNRYR